jgi:hypothetical protein
MNKDQVAGNAMQVIEVWRQLDPKHNRREGCSRPDETFSSDDNA